jgi:hypothetical protein
VKRCGPSRRRGSAAPAVLKNFFRPPKGTFATLSASSRHEPPQSITSSANRAFDPIRLNGEMAETPPDKFCAFPCNGGDIRRGRKQLFHNRLAPRIGKRKSVFVSGRRNRYQPIPVSEQIRDRYANPGAHANNSLYDGPCSKPHRAPAGSGYFCRLWIMIRSGADERHAHQLAVFALDHPASGRYRLRFWA